MFAFLYVVAVFGAPPTGPAHGHYFAEDFAETFRRTGLVGGIDGETRYATHREPSLRWEGSRLYVDHGQEVVALSIRSSKRSDGGLDWMSSLDGQAWSPLHLKVLGADRFETDASGELKTWVRLPGSFEALMALSRERRGASVRDLWGTYRSARESRPDVETFELGAGHSFRIVDCFVGCRQTQKARCVVDGKRTLKVDGRALIEVKAVRALCALGMAIVVPAGATRFELVTR